MKSYTIRCPKCDRLTQHKQSRKRGQPKDAESNYYMCTACLRTRRISEEELAELLYAASRHPHTFLREAI